MYSDSPFPGNASRGDDDQLYRFLFDQLPIRGEWVRLEDSWHEIMERGDYPTAVRQLLGKACAATTLLVATLKFEGQLTLQIEGIGPLKRLVVRCDHEFRLRGLAHYQAEAFANGQTPERLLEEARLTITIDANDQNDRYQGTVAAESDDLAVVLEAYFNQSEQLPTRLWLVADETRVGGLLIQRLPGESTDEDAWDRCSHLAGTVTTEEMLSLSANDLLKRLFYEEDIQVFPPAQVIFKCHCSRERLSSILKSLGEPELKDILAQEGSVKATCEFCNSNYVFDTVDVAQLFASHWQTPSTNTRQ